MSNNLVGGTYREVIEDVINMSRLDFEDAGIDDTTLRELQLLWQEKLSLSGTARFPWDPEPPSPASTAAAHAHAAAAAQAAAAHTAAAQAAVASHATYGGARVKYEMASPPGLQPVSYPTISTAPHAFSNPAMAAMRAAQQIQEFAREERVPAAVADESIKGVMKRAGLDEEHDGSGAGNGGGLMLPGGGRLAQVDGPTPGAVSNMSTADVDRLLELHILRHHGASSMAPSTTSSTNTPRITARQHNRTITFTVLSQTDGPMDSDSDDDDEDEDEDDNNLGMGRNNNSVSQPIPTPNGNDSDAINSDLDDSDDEINSQNDDDGEDAGMLMLCLYDKVQRTKNKWKCVLKDGVVNVNGRDYLFGKGSGEYEW
ncbi:transcription factor IIA, alpha/beta subunit [Limtongia smithiae]|uniref:transcription factor IIA, alpha/beta subunit n=1 Tax=Limtongia smithiae TaxID=1125753 RepID=UPI0034CEAA63